MIWVTMIYIGNSVRPTRLLCQIIIRSDQELIVTSKENEGGFALLELSVEFSRILCIFMFSN